MAIRAPIGSRHKQLDHTASSSCKVVTIKSYFLSNLVVQLDKNKRALSSIEFYLQKLMGPKSACWEMLFSKVTSMPGVTQVGPLAYSCAYIHKKLFEKVCKVC